MLIRQAEPQDAGMVADLNVVVQRLHHDQRPEWFTPPDASGFEPVVRKWLSRGSSRMFIAEVEGTPVGCVLAILHERPATPLTVGRRFVELDQIAVVPEHRGKGVGRALVTAVFEYARQVEVDSVHLSVWDFNETAMRFFDGLGFGPVWRRLVRPVG